MAGSMAGSMVEPKALYEKYINDSFDVKCQEPNETGNYTYKLTTGEHFPQDVHIEAFTGKSTHAANTDGVLRLELSEMHALYLAVVDFIEVKQMKKPQETLLRIIPPRKMLYLVQSPPTPYRSENDIEEGLDNIADLSLVYKYECGKDDCGHDLKINICCKVYPRDEGTSTPVNFWIRIELDPDTKPKRQINLDKDDIFCFCASLCDVLKENLVSETYLNIKRVDQGKHKGQYSITSLLHSKQEDMDHMMAK